MQIYISADHGGFELKEKLKSWRAGEQESTQFQDLGPEQLDPEDDYPNYAFPLAEKVVATSDAIGILICRSGNGMTIAANKVKGARAALCFTAQHATKAVEDDHANILVLDADYLSFEEHQEIVRAFLTAKPKGDKYLRRVELIQAYENSN